MAKKSKKGEKSRSARAGGTLPPPVQPGKSGQKGRTWLLPLVFGGASVFVLFVGVPWALGVLFPKTPSQSSRSASVATTTDTKTEAKLPDLSPTRPAPDRTPTRSAPVRGLVAALPRGDVKGQFGGDEGLASDFATARDDLAGGKSTMAVRNRLEPLLNRAGDNPGREHLLAALAYTELKTRDGQKAANHLEELLQQYPKSSYAAQARVMRVEADLVQATPKGKDAKADAATVQAIIARADALAAKETDTEAKAYAKFVAATGYDVLDDEARAIAAYQEVARDFPSAPQAPSALYRAGRAQQQGGSVDAAIATYEKLIDAYPSEDATKEARKAVRELRIIGQPAPELKVEDWASGGPAPLADLKGKVVLVNFWQTWCPHCRDEWPHLAERYEKYKSRGLVVIGATRNDKRQDPEKLAEFLQGNPAPYPVARVSQQSASDYAVSGIPAAALVDRQGIIRWRGHPGTLTDQELERYLAQN